MICPKCSAPAPDGALYCCMCGRQLVREKRTHARPSGLGSVYYDRRADRWVAQAVVGRSTTPEGKVRFSYVRRYFKKKSDAMKALPDLAEQANVRPAFTLSHYYQAFTAGKGEKISDSKRTAYRIAYNRLKPIWNTAVDRLTIADLQALVNDTCDSYYPARDVRALLNALFRLAHADNAAINPVLPSLLELPKMEEDSPDPFTEEEQIALWVSYEDGNLDAALPLIMIYTGMMTGEMRRLTKQMIDLPARQIVHVGLKTKERKKKAVLLPDDIVPVLEDVMNRAENDLLYPMTETKFYELYYAALKTAGITRHLTPYSCRHTTATVLAVHDNVAPQTLQRVMRWKSTRMMDRYVTPSDTDARTAVNRI